MRRLNLILFSLLALGGTMTSCSNNPAPSEPTDKNNVNITYNQFDNVSYCEDLQTFINDSKTVKAHDYGTIISPYYELVINDKNIPVYAFRSGNGIHSYAYVRITKKDLAKDFFLHATIYPTQQCTALYSDSIIECIPLKNAVQPVFDVDNWEIRATMYKLGSYTFVIDQKHIQPLTIMVVEEENPDDVFGDKEIVYLDPGDYRQDKTKFVFTEQNKVYYFTKGVYHAYTITIPSNSICYFEDGAYVYIMPGDGYGLNSSGTENVTFFGYGLIDYSRCCGSDDSTGLKSDKSGNVFQNVKNIEVRDITIVNSQTWTVCFYGCENVHVKNICLFSYRTFSDGVMLSDVKNGYVEHSFARTGDDAFEVKSLTYTGISKNVVFEYNDCWSDKAIAYGAVYEDAQDIEDVHFRHCTVGFALAHWQGGNHIGCLTVQRGQKYPARCWHDITFNDIEIYHSSNYQLISLTNGGYELYKGYGELRDIFFSNITCYHNDEIGNPMISFKSGLESTPTGEAVIPTFGDIYVSNIISNNVKLTQINITDKNLVVNRTYSDDTHPAFDIQSVLHLENGKTYE